jgi:hypothetical protein
MGMLGITESAVEAPVPVLDRHHVTAKQGRWAVERPFRPRTGFVSSAIGDSIACRGTGVDHHFRTSGDPDGS